jgi:flotillin
VSTGDGHAAGMNKITGDIAAMAAQVPALFETLSGMKMAELLGHVRGIGDKSPKPDALPPGGGDEKGNAAGAGK